MREKKFQPVRSAHPRSVGFHVMDEVSAPWKTAFDAVMYETSTVQYTAYPTQQASTVSNMEVAVSARDS